MNPIHTNPAPHATRRQFLQNCGMGVGMMGLTSLLGQDGYLPGAHADTAGALTNPMAAKQPHFAPKAKRVIHLFMNGGPSHVDTFDPKPALQKWAGKEIPKNLKHRTKNGRTRFPRLTSSSSTAKAAFRSARLFSHVGESCG